MDRAFGLNIPESLDELCIRSRSVLLIYDMQVGIVSQVREGTQVVERVQRLLRSARAAGLRVVYTRHYNVPLSWAGVGQLRMAKTWQRARSASSLQPRLLAAPRPEDIVIDKVTMSALEGTPLPMLLRDLGLVGFMVAGIALEVGIEPTARQGGDLGLIPVVADSETAKPRSARWPR